MHSEDRDAIRAMLRRAAIVAADDSGAQQLLTLTGLAGEQLKKVVNVQPFGLSSNPPVGGQGVLLSLGGRSDRAMFFGGEHGGYRQKNLAAGAAVLYDQNGNVIFADMANGISISAATGAVTVKAATGQMVYLGGTGSDGTYDFVKTATGTAIGVKARIA